MIITNDSSPIAVEEVVTGDHHQSTRSMVLWRWRPLKNPTCRSLRRGRTWTCISVCLFVCAPRVQQVLFYGPFDNVRAIIAINGAAPGHVIPNEEWIVHYTQYYLPCTYNWTAVGQICALCRRYQRLKKLFVVCSLYVYRGYYVDRPICVKVVIQ